jgi:hypothetical protein
MTSMTRSEEASGASLLRRAISDPFIILSASDGTDGFFLWDWARHLRSSFPLWCFRPHSFAALHRGELPTTHPLGQIIRSVVADESAECSNESFALDGPDALPLILDSRRCSLADARAAGFSDQVDRDSDRYRLIGCFGARFSRLLDGPVLASSEEDTEYSSGGYASPYEDIGLRIVQLVEARASAVPGTDDWRAASAQIEGYLRDLAIRVPGRPTNLRDAAARRIVDEGEELVRLVASAVGEKLEVSDLTRQVLESFGIQSSEMFAWALRLVVPCFSGLELQALEAARRDWRGRPDAFPRDFAVRLLAHRLRLPAATIARKAMDGWAAEVMDPAGVSCRVCGANHGG